MNPEVKIEKLPKSKIVINVKVSAAEFDKCWEEALEHITQNAELEGFRKGKAPKEMVAKAAGDGHILEHATDDAVNQAYFKVMQENKLDLVGQPEVEVLKVAKGNDLEFKITGFVLPDIKLPDYQKIVGKLKKEEVKVEEKEVEDSIKWLQQSLATFTEKSEPAQSGDWVEIVFKINEEQENKDAFILGKGRLIPEIEKGIEGMSNGQSKTIEFKFKNGEDAKCQLNLVVVKNVHLPEVNDEFAKNVGNFASVADLENNIRADIQKGKENQVLEKAISQAMQEVAKEVSVEIPELLIQREIEANLRETKKKIESDSDLAWEEYLKKVGKTEEEIRKSMVEPTERKIKEYFILKEVQKQEKVEATEEEIQYEVQKIMGQYPDLQGQDQFDLENLMAYTKERIESDKTFKKLGDYLQK